MRRPERQEAVACIDMAFSRSVVLCENIQSILEVTNIDKLDLEEYIFH